MIIFNYHQDIQKLGQDQADQEEKIYLESKWEDRRGSPRYKVGKNYQKNYN